MLADRPSLEGRVGVGLACLLMGAMVIGNGCSPPPLQTKAPRLSCGQPLAWVDPKVPTQAMVALPGGRFTMGAQAERPEEGPARTVVVKPFWIDRTTVTNGDFARFVAATGYRTVAERPLDAAQYPWLPPMARQPASLVFVGAHAGVDKGDPTQWWHVIPGADWRHPYGPGSDIKGMDAFPVVHVAYDDALAYARWLGHDLPSEAEWEYAARGGRDGARYSWGDDPVGGGGHPKANVWQGIFPVFNSGQDGFKAQTAPVGCYPANGFGLFDMTGNVWQWTRDLAAPDLGDQRVILSRNAALQHMIKGGSFLCSDDFCFRYRPSARTAGPPNSGASHIGFRTVLRLKPGS